MKNRPTFQVFLPLALFALALLTSCVTKDEPHPNTMVLSYSELGPQVLVYDLIGYEWYQWNSHGDSDPNTIDDVKVVVYRNIPLEKVKEIYPVIKGKQDYRYLDYETAIDYINKNIDKSYLEHLARTKKKIIARLGS